MPLASADGKRFRRTAILAGIAGILIGIGVASWWRAHGDTQESPAPLGATGQTDLGLSSQRRSTPLVAGTPPASARQDETLPEAELVRLFAGYEQRFREDVPDPAWAPVAERALIEAASEPALAAHGLPSDFDAHCLGHMCKVAITFEDGEVAIDWSNLYVVGMAGAVSRVQSRLEATPDGKHVLVLYGTRAGSEGLLDPAGQVR